MAVARLSCSEIVDWETLHTACARELGLPDFYGRNGDAWIDCLSCVTEDEGMSRFTLEPDEKLRIELIGSASLRQRAPRVLEALVDWTQCVNDRLVETGDRPRLELAFL